MGGFAFLNRTQLIGNVTVQPELKTTPQGQFVTSFSVATNRSYKNKDGEIIDQAEFHSVVAWGKLAEIATKLIKKGTKVFVEGRLAARQWEDKDAVKRQKTEIICENLILLNPKPKVGHQDDAPPRGDLDDLF